MLVKECRDCGKEKDISFFSINRSKDDGKDIYCRECLSARRKAKYWEGRPIKEKNKTEDMAAYMREWHAKHPGYRTRKKAEWLERNKERRLSTHRYKEAKKTGKLEKLPCIVCGSLEVEGHHPDYDQPLQVVWLCKDHHREVHKMHRELS